MKTELWRDYLAIVLAGEHRVVFADSGLRLEGADAAAESLQPARGLEVGAGAANGR
jgi:hypothetical protein